MAGTNDLYTKRLYNGITVEASNDNSICDVFAFDSYFNLKK